MLKNFRTWFWAAVVFQFLTAAFHTVGLFVTPDPYNETERRLFELMDTYRFDLGVGFTPTMGNLFMALSSCFSLLCLFAGLMNAFLLKKRAASELMGGVLLINIVVFGICFGMMAVLTFLPPIILTGLIFFCSLVALVLWRMRPEAAPN